MAGDFQILCRISGTRLVLLRSSVCKTALLFCRRAAGLPKSELSPARERLCSMPSPNHQSALRVLDEGVKKCAKFTPKRLSTRQQEGIRSIILGSHLTFRYLLMTALLAKVVEPRIHMRSLQARAKLEGAYDARSLCHNVWVPFEREQLDSRLGGSNEPFLNKPARFPAIEKTNAVRAGRDRDLLHTLYDLLESLNKANASIHKEAFLYALSLVMERGGQTPSEVPLSPVVLTSSAVLAFVDEYLSKSFGGEVPVSVVGAVLSARHRDRKSEIRVHPANQAGTSSNEVGDIDVCLGDAVALPVEVKDKSFGKADVEHAVKKARDAECPRLLFVMGRHATPADDVDMEELTAAHAKRGFDLAFVTVEAVVRSEIPLLSEPERRNLIQRIHRHLMTMRAKDETKRHFEATLKSAGLTHRKAKIRSPSA